MLLVYSPERRLKPLAACAHPFFDELRKPNRELPNGHPIPTCVDFTVDELGAEASLMSVLRPQVRSSNPFSLLLSLIEWFA